MVLLWQYNLLLWFQQGIELTEEIGEQMEEYGIEVVEEFLDLIFLHLLGTRHLPDVIKLVGFRLAVDFDAVVVEFVDVF